MLARVTRFGIAGQARNARCISGLVSSVLNTHDTNSQQYQTARADPTLPLPNHAPMVQTGGQGKVTVSTLSNGVTVVSVSPTFPGVVDFNVFMDVGTRDETRANSGALLALQNTYLKTILTTNETINYGMVQMSGGSSGMLYDQETSQFRASCLSHDAVDIFNMIVDCALEPKCVVAASVGIEKGKHTHALQGVHDSGVSFKNLLTRTAFGLTGLGMPLAGIPGNVGNLDATALQKFQMSTVRPDRLWVAGAGVEDHHEFEDLVERKLSFMPSLDAQNNGDRTPSEYLGGDNRVGNESNTVDMSLIFQGANWTDKDMVALQVANALLGDANAFKLQTRHAPSNRSWNNVVSQNNYVDSFGGVNMCFSDNGLFGVRVSGMASHSNQLWDLAVNELRGLKDNVGDAELHSAKQTLNVALRRGLERQSDSLAETLRNLKTFGSVRHQDYTNMVNEVTSDDVNRAVAKALSSNATFVAQGGNVERLPSSETLKNSLN